MLAVVSSRPVTGAPISTQLCQSLTAKLLVGSHLFTSIQNLGQGCSQSVLAANLFVPKAGGSGANAGAAKQLTMSAADAVAPLGASTKAAPTASQLAALKGKGGNKRPGMLSTQGGMSQSGSPAPSPAPARSVSSLAP